jgi:hypothetical protein
LFSGLDLVREAPPVGASRRLWASRPDWAAPTRRGPTWAIRRPTVEARANRGDSRRQELPPQAALLAPVEGGGQGHQVGQDDRIATTLGQRQKEQRFLNVRR